MAFKLTPLQDYALAVKAISQLTFMISRDAPSTLIRPGPSTGIWLGVTLDTLILASEKFHTYDFIILLLLLWIPLIITYKKIKRS